MTNHGRLAYIAHLWSKKCAIDDIEAHFLGAALYFFHFNFRYVTVVRYIYIYIYIYKYNMHIYISDDRYIPEVEMKKI